MTLDLPPLTRGSWLEIDLGVLADNLRLVRQAAGGDGVEMNAVVKADAYGHGAEAVARTFVDAGATRLCVATLDEALLLRDAGLTAPILVLFGVPDEQVAVAARAGVELTVADESGVAALVRSAAAVTVHVEVETGLGREGIRPDRVAHVAGQLNATNGVHVAGIWTHLAAAEDEAGTSEQLRLFDRAVQSVAAAGLPVPGRHVAASGGILAASAPSYEGVRPGLCLYGLLPEDVPIAAGNEAIVARLRPAMALRGRPLRIEPLAPGEGVGYNSRWRAERPSLVATIPVGYSDGWPRASWPGSEAIVNGRRAPFVGTVAMDASMVDVTDVPGVSRDSVFTLLGRDGEQEITAHDLARLRTTISWEVVATMAQRLPRVYHRGPVLVGTRTLTGEPHDGVTR